MSGTRVVAGFCLGGFLGQDGYGITRYVVVIVIHRRYIVVGEELIPTCHVEVGIGAEAEAGAELGELVGIGGSRIDCLDNLVGRYNLRPIVVPDELAVNHLFAKI